MPRSPSILPPTIPCPFPGIPGAEIKRGPRKGKCRYPAELMDPYLTDRPPYYRCARHGTLPDQHQPKEEVSPVL